MINKTKWLLLTTTKSCEIIVLIGIMRENKEIIDECSVIWGRRGTDEKNSETIVKENGCGMSDCGNVGGCDAGGYVAD